MKTAAKHRGSTRRWRKLRRFILERDGYRCRWCGRRASHADHVRAIADGGAMWDPANLVAACPLCNLRRGAEVSARRGNRRAAGERDVWPGAIELGR